MNRADVGMWHDQMTDLGLSCNGRTCAAAPLDTFFANVNVRVLTASVTLVRGSCVHTQVVVFLLCFFFRGGPI